MFNKKSSIMIITLMILVIITFAGNGSRVAGKNTEIDPSSIIQMQAIVASRCDDKDDLPGIYLYEDSNLNGRCSRFKSGTSNLTIEYVKNDTASSIRLIGDYIATVYEHANYHGTNTIFTHEDLNFGDNPIGHDQASSIRVRSRNTVCDGSLGLVPNLN